MRRAKHTNTKEFCCNHTALSNLSKMPPTQLCLCSLTSYPTASLNGCRVYKYLTPPPLATLCLPITAHALSQRVRVVQIKTTTNWICVSLYVECALRRVASWGGRATGEAYLPTTYGITMSKSERLTVTAIGKAKANPILSASIN